MEILEMFPWVFCFRKSHINEKGGKKDTYFDDQTKIFSFVFYYSFVFHYLLKERANTFYVH